MKLIVSTVYESLVPPLTESEYQSLKESIKQNGIWIPIVVNKHGAILDGHHRYRACQEVEKSIKYVVREFENELLEKKFVIECNLKRRHLNDYQKGILAKELLKIEEGEAKLRQKEAGSEYGENHSKSLPTDMGNVDRHDKTSMVITAKKVGLKSGEQLRRILKIDEEASEELKQKVSNGETSINYAYKTVNRQEKKANAEPIPEGEFDVILADPPWKYDINTRGSPDDHYDVMEDQDISKLKIPSSDNCVLFMWGTAPKLPEALAVIEAWGFTYKTNMVWVKDKIGTGYYFRGKHELLFVAVKGTPLIPEEVDRPESVLIAPRTTHSKKPEEVYGIIERMYPNAKYLELFARNTRNNWQSWGNEIA